MMREKIGRRALFIGQKEIDAVEPDIPNPADESGDRPSSLAETPHDILSPIFLPFISTLASGDMTARITVSDVPDPYKSLAESFNTLPTRLSSSVPPPLQQSRIFDQFPIPLAIVAAVGTVVSVNKAGSELFDEGQVISHLLPEGMLAKAAHGEESVADADIADRHGQITRHHLTILPLPPEGPLSGNSILLCEKISPAICTTDYIIALVKNLTIPTALLQQDGTVIEANEPMAVLTGHDIRNIRDTVLDLPTDRYIGTGNHTPLPDPIFRTTIPFPDESSPAILVQVPDITPIRTMIHTLEDQIRAITTQTSEHTFEESPPSPPPPEAVVLSDESAPVMMPSSEEIGADIASHHAAIQAGEYVEKGPDIPEGTLSIDQSGESSEPLAPERVITPFPAADEGGITGYGEDYRNDRGSSPEEPALPEQAPIAGERPLPPDKVPPLKETREKTPGTPTDPLQVVQKSQDIVQFTLGEEEYALDIKFAREIVEMMPITPIPRSPSYLVGIMNLRGEITNIINIYSLLGLPKPETHEGKKIIVLSSEATGGENIGMIVDDVRSVTMIQESDIEQLGEGVSHKVSGKIKGIIKSRERGSAEQKGEGEEECLVIWIDMQRIIEDLLQQRAS